MKIHTNTLTTADLWACMARAAELGRTSGVYVDSAEQVGSRSHSHAIRFRLAADQAPGRRRPRNTGTYGAEGSWRDGGERHQYAATWDDHGHWMAQVFEVDPLAVFSHGGASSASYRGREHFHAATGCKYVPLPLGWEVAQLGAAACDRAPLYTVRGPGIAPLSVQLDGVPAVLSYARETIEAQRAQRIAA